MIVTPQKKLRNITRNLIYSVPATVDQYDPERKRSNFHADSSSSEGLSF